MGAQKKRRSMAEKADKYKCYLKSVQSPEHEVEFFDKAFKDEFHRKPTTLREDFCGTFSVCCEWVKLGRQRTALGVDLDPEPLAWGEKHILSKLQSTQASRVRILEKDVREKTRPAADVLAAQNFSFWLFKTRKELLEYFRVARSNMSRQSVMVMDMMGGGDCYAENTVEKKVVKKGKKGFSYHWKQVQFNPVTHEADFSISFKFADGSKLQDAFQYNWRFWTIAEVRELLEEAGFKKSYVYWEEEDEDGEDTGEWIKAEQAESYPSWLCYIVAVK